MIRKWTFRIAALPLLLGIAAATSSRADAPWYNLLATRRVEADPAKEYTLKEDHGPWIIMACSFNGENAGKQAKALVLELRTRYRMEAFVYQHDFKLDDPNGNAQPLSASPPSPSVSNVQRRIAMPTATGRSRNSPWSWAISPPSTIRTPSGPCKTLKSADPECLHSNQEAAQSRSLAAWRSLQATVTNLPKFMEGPKQRGPLAHAFITRNPLLPEDYFAPKGGVDELVLKMNKNVEHSLLDCPGKYTVQVAHFTGEVIINQGEIQAIETGAKTGPESAKQGLAGAAEKAHELTEALRIKGWEAYEFHDRHASLVTVGSFNVVGTPRPDGKIEINPQIYHIIESFRANPRNVAGVVGAMEPQVAASASSSTPSRSWSKCPTLDQPPVVAAARHGRPVEVPTDASSPGSRHRQPQEGPRACPAAGPLSVCNFARWPIIPRPWRWWKTATRSPPTRH